MADGEEDEYEAAEGVGFAVALVQCRKLGVFKYFRPPI